MTPQAMGWCGVLSFKFHGQVSEWEGGSSMAQALFFQFQFPLHPPSFYAPPPPSSAASIFICAAPLLNGSPEGRYVTLVQRPVRLAVFYSIVKCLSWWKWPKETLCCWKDWERTHTQTPTHTSIHTCHNTVPQWKTPCVNIYPPNSTVLLTLL